MSTEPKLSFFQHPFWRPFVGREVFVVSLSEPEHRLRDARALIALRDFLPPEESGLTSYFTVTVGGAEKPHWPEMVLRNPEAGVVVLGRPSSRLHGEEAQAFLKQCAPPLLYQFGSDDPKIPAIGHNIAYRSIVGQFDGRHDFPGASFQGQQGGEVRDLGIIYSGFHGKRPVAILAGSSTISTWGCVVAVTKELPGSEPFWRGNVQGIIRAAAANTPRAFSSVTAEVHEKQMLTPVSIWMEGADLPLSNCWRNGVIRTTARDLDLRILVNGQPILKRMRDHLTALTMIAWLNSRDRSEYDSGLCRVTCNTVQAQDWIDQFLGNGGVFGFRKEVQPRLNKILNEITRQIWESGGLATLKKPPSGPTSFTLWAFPPPLFLPQFSP